MHRFCLPIVVLSLLAATAVAQGPEENSGDQIKVFNLLNLEADSAAKILKDVLGKSDGVTLTVDPAQNRLIANASPERLDLIEAILLKLDESPRNSSAKFSVYKLAHAKAQEVTKILSDVFSTREDVDGVRLGVDEKLNAVVAYGSERAHEEVRLLLESLDRPIPHEAEPIAKSIRFDIYWIADGTEGSPVPAKIAQVMEKQDQQLGISMPVVLANASTACYVDSRTRGGLVSFKHVKAPEGLEMDCEAMITPLDDQSFKIMLRLSAGGPSMTSIETTIRTKLDHLVFFASTTTSSESRKPTVFVVKISEEEATKMPVANSPQGR